MLNQKTKKSTVEISINVLQYQMQCMTVDHLLQRATYKKLVHAETLQLRL